MSEVEYDIMKLKQSCGIDAKNAVRRLGGYEAFFLDLEKFERESKYYLSAYTPKQILDDPNERRDFRDDIRQIKLELSSLGITGLMPVFSELDYEAQNGSEMSLEKWLAEFHDKIGKLASSIASAKISSSGIPDEPPPERVKKQEPKPENEEAPKAEQEEDTKPAAARPGDERPQILAVDDKPELLTMLVAMVGDKYKVMAVTSGPAALKLIERHPPALFLLDIEMPGMDGYELATAIRANGKFKTTPIIFLTSKNSRQNVLSAIQLGGNEYLLKPVNKDLLLSKLEDHLG